MKLPHSAVAKLSPARSSIDNDSRCVEVFFLETGKVWLPYFAVVPFSAIPRRQKVNRAQHKRKRIKYHENQRRLAKAARQAAAEAESS